jgi:hypothetical protein
MLVSISTIPAAANIGVALAMANPSEAGKSLSILLVNLAGPLAGGVLTLLGTRVWHAGSRPDKQSPGPSQSPALERGAEPRARSRSTRWVAL